MVFTTCDGYEVTIPAIFPLPEAMVRGPRVLKESTAVLRILLGFMGPAGRQPALEDEPFDIQLAVAEAAEKYSIFSAMNFCRYLLRYVSISRLFSLSNTLIESDLAPTLAGDPGIRNSTSL